MLRRTAAGNRRARRWFATAEEEAGGALGACKVVVSLGVVALLGCAAPAQAHPSDFRTMTVDVVLASRGIEVIDVAVVPVAGPSYEPFVTDEEKEGVALELLAALDILATEVLLDVDQSDRYHEVGFTIRFGEPRSVAGSRPAIVLDGAELQAVAAAAGVDSLKLSVCAVESYVTGETGLASPDLLPQVEIEASRAGSRRTDRAGCHVWILGPDQPPLELVVGRTSLAETGGMPPIGEAVAVLVMGTSLWIAAKRRSSTRASSR